MYVYAANDAQKRNFHFPGCSRVYEAGHSLLAMRGHTHPQEIRANRCTLFGDTCISIVSMRTVQQNSIAKTYIQQRHPEDL